MSMSMSMNINRGGASQLRLPPKLAFPSTHSQLFLTSHTTTRFLSLSLNRRYQYVSRFRFYSHSASDTNFQRNQQQPCCDPATSIGGSDLDDIDDAVSSDLNENDDNPRVAPTSTSQSKNAKRELIMLCLPAVGGLVIEPMVQLMETAFIGQLGSLELASAGVSITLFNVISRIFNISLLSITTSFVAEDISKNTHRFSTSGEKQQLSSVSSALLLAVGLGIFEAMVLSFGSGPLLSLMGTSKNSSMRDPAQRFLILRALGAPALVASLALQGIFRGFKDTKTPVFCLGFGSFIAIFLFPLFMHYLHFGVFGAAISAVVSQYIIAFTMLWHLNKRAVLLPPKLGDLEFGSYVKSGGFLIGRTMAVLLTMTLGTSMAARQGPVPMAAHQICLQLWLAVSLITDAFATSAQALIASYVAKNDYRTVKDITHFVLKIGFVAGASLAVLLGVSFSSLATFFTKDPEVLRLVRTGALFVSATQPINALAFVFDGLHYGISDFAYAAFSMMLVGALSSAFLLYAPTIYGLYGVWLGLTLLMGLRMVAGIVRLLEPRGPWWFLHVDVKEFELAH